MAEIWDRIAKAACAAGGAIVGLLGGWSPLLTALCVFMAVDYLTGLMVAWKGKSSKTENGGLSSKAGFDGLLRKAVILLVVFLAAILDSALDMGKTMFTSACVCYYIANEGISILENAALIGVPVPPVIRRALELLKEKGDGKEEE